ncbi:MAG: hypothetical protein JOZ94_16435, partial [Xanthobacteraceae bacterium]|nr:hypothetical protein [Xanthobacteraceae bacterium]
MLFLYEKRTWFAVAPIAILVMMGASAHAQTADEYPSRELRVICAFPPGSGAAVWVRFFAEQANSRAGKPVLVENK